MLLFSVWPWIHWKKFRIILWKRSWTMLSHKNVTFKYRFGREMKAFILPKKLQDKRECLNSILSVWLQPMDDLLQHLISHLLRPSSDYDWVPHPCSKVFCGNHINSEWIKKKKKLLNCPGVTDAFWAFSVWLFLPMKISLSDEERPLDPVRIHPLCDISFLQIIK